MVLLKGADAAEKADDDADDADDDDEHGRVVDAATEERQVVPKRALQHCAADYEYYANNEDDKIEGEQEIFDDRQRL